MEVAKPESFFNKVGLFTAGFITTCFATFIVIYFCTIFPLGILKKRSEM